MKRLLHRDGLGLRNVVKMNQALQGKWILQFMIENGALWNRVIEGKFDTLDGGWHSREV